MKIIKNDINSPKPLQSKSFGEFKVISIKSSAEVLIRFIDTGYECITTKYRAKIGSVKDRLYPSVYGVGFIGDGLHKCTSGGKMTKARACWSSMIQRCYSPCKNQISYFDCEVCEEWQNFQNFAEWYNENYPKDGSDYDLDKDIKVKGNRIYSPETCTFVSRSENVKFSNSKSYLFLNPNGNLIKVWNLSDLCRKHNLDHGHMSAVHLGKRKSHKGWVKGSA